MNATQNEPTEFEFLENDANALALKIYEKSDHENDWREAGYSTALECALVLVGDSVREPLRTMAAKILAGRIE